MVVVPEKFELHERMHSPMVWCNYEIILILGKFSSFFGYIIGRALIDFGNNRIEPIGNRFSVGKFNRIYRYFSFGKLPFGFGKFGFGFGFSIYRTDLPII